jgi:hypothetical protein
MSELDDPIFVQYMQSDDIAMAQASDVAYKHELNLNANPETANEETQKLINERFTEPHFLVPEFSNEHAITIERPNKEYIMAVRGTRPTNISDLKADAQILLNDRNNNRVNSVEKLYKSFRDEQPDAKLTITGHSLGSYVGHVIANKYDEDFVGFSHPASLGVLTENFENAPTAEHKIYLTKNLDIISSLNKYGKFNDNIITLPQKQETQQDYFGSHSIKNFLPNKKEKLKPKIIKTKRGRNTYYSTPNAEDIRRSYNSSASTYDNCQDNPSLEKCNKKITKALKQERTLFN